MSFAVSRGLVLFAFLFSFSVEATSDKASNALFDAIKANDLAAFEAALETGVSPDAVSSKGAPAIAAAVLAERPKMAHLLLEAGANPDAPYPDYIGATALMLSVQTKDILLADELLAAGADINIQDNNGDPAINWAAYYGYHEFVHLFLRRGAQTSLAGHGTAREIAMRRGHQSVVSMLARHEKISLPDPDAAMLAQAVFEGRIEDTEEALIIGVSPHSPDFTGRPLIALAARLGHTEIVQTLLDRGADVDAQDEIGFTPLMEAARDNRVETVKMLIAAGANIDHRSKENGLSLSVIHLAALSGNPEVVSAVSNADLNVLDRDGNTALMWAIGERKLEAAAALLRLGADPYIATDDGFSAADMIKSQRLADLQALVDAQHKVTP